MSFAGNSSLETTPSLEKSTVVIFAVAIVVRLINLVSIDELAGIAFAEDSSIYWHGAKAWLDSGYFSRISADGFVPETERVPLYHLFLIPFRWAFGEALFPVLLVQSIIDSVTCVLIAKICATSSRRIGLIAGLLAALWPNLIIHSQLIFAETLFVFLFTGFLYFAVQFMRTARWLELVYAGAICGLAILTRPVALFVPFLAALIVPCVVWRLRGRWLPGIGAALVMVMTTLLVLSPLLWRNATNFGTIQLTTQSGTHFLNWVVGYAVGLEQGKPFSQGSLEIQTRLHAKLEREGRKNLKEMGPFERSAAQMEHVALELRQISVTTLARAWVSGAIINLASPAIAIDPRIRHFNQRSLVNTTGHHLVDRVFEFLNGNDSRFVYWMVLGLFMSGVSCSLQFVGMIILLRTHFWPGVFGCLLITYFLLINGPVGAPKYRLPFEPIMIIFQAIALSSIGSWLGRVRDQLYRRLALSQ
jgi:4-amino-4-deoxy-L-arabinose transferase-like glycosyltransferase